MIARSVRTGAASIPIELHRGAVAPRSSLRAGLSLIEVLLALTIFLLALVVLARLVDMGTERELEARFQTIGARLASTKLAEVESGFESMTSTDGTFEGDDSAWTWTMSAEAQAAPDLYLVTVTVSRDLKGRQFSLALSQMVLDPVVFGGAGEAARPDPNAAPPPGGSGP